VNRNILSHRCCWFLISLVLVVCAPAAAQWKDNMGGSWNNPTSASIGNIINDQLWNRMRAKARARAKSGNSAPANTSRKETPPAEPEVSKKTPAQIDAAVRFRSTGTQLRTQAFADFLSDGGTPETKKQMPAIISALLTEYEKAARAQGKPNDLALATTAALVYNSSIYNGTPDPEDARIMEIRDALAELAAEDGTFTSMTDRQKQELYENLVISTMLAKVGYEEAKKTSDEATMATYRSLAGQTLRAVSGMPPEKIDFSTDAPAMNAARILDAASTNSTNQSSPATGPQSVPPTKVSSSEFLDFDPFPDKPYVQPQKPLLGGLRKTITMADLAGTWEIGGASVQTYVSSGTNSHTDASFYGKKYFIHSDGTFDSKFQGRASNTTIRESDSGTVILSGGFITLKSRQNPAMRYQFVAFMDQPNRAAVLSLIYIGENAPLDGETLRANCAHANGYVSCLNGEEWVRIP
jgi:hypothetical protein